MNPRGYHSREYGNSFSAFGEIITLPASGMKLIKRNIRKDLFDVTGLYPYSLCREWSKLGSDLSFLRELGAVSIVFVASPFCAMELEKIIPNWVLCKPFKQHFIVNLNENWRSQRTKNTRYYCNASFKHQEVEIVRGSEKYAELFWSLYKPTIDKHNISGIQKMSLSIIAKQLRVKGAQLLIARQEDIPVGAMIVYNQGEVANAHLMGLSSEAYKIHTSYALIYTALTAFEEQGCRFANLGGSAGLKNNPRDGLHRFKSRWTKDIRTSLLCGEILNADAYKLLVGESFAQPEVNFFPEYRFPGSKYEWLP